MRAATQPNNLTCKTIHVKGKVDMHIVLHIDTMRLVGMVGCTFCVDTQAHHRTR